MMTLLERFRSLKLFSSCDWCGANSAAECRTHPYNLICAYPQPQHDADVKTRLRNAQSLDDHDPGGGPIKHRVLPTFSPPM